MNVGEVAKRYGVIYLRLSNRCKLARKGKLVVTLEPPNGGPLAMAEVNPPHLPPLGSTWIEARSVTVGLDGDVSITAIASVQRGTRRSFPPPTSGSWRRRARQLQEATRRACGDSHER